MPHADDRTKLFVLLAPSAWLLVGGNGKQLLGVYMVDVVAVLRVDVWRLVAAWILRAHPKLLDRLPGETQPRRPAHQRAPIVRHLLRPIVEVALRNLLAALTRLVRAEVNDRHVGGRRERAKFVDQLAQDDLRLFARKIIDARRLAERERMAGHVELGNDRYAARLRKGKDVLELGLRVELPDLSRERLILLELWMLLGFEPPAVVVRDVPVEDIELVVRAGRDDVLDRLDALVVASAVEHQPAILELRPVVNIAIGNCGSIGFR